jgi:hypothetical protein
MEKNRIFSNINLKGIRGPMVLWAKYPSGLNSVAGQRTGSCDIGVILKSKVNINNRVYVH